MNFFKIISSLILVFLILLIVACNSYKRKYVDEKEIATNDSSYHKKTEAESAPKFKDTLTTSPKIYSTEIKTLNDFENSHFFEDYKCYKDDSWPLKNGIINHYYKTNLHSPISIEISTLNEKFKSIGIVFYDRNKLDKKELIFIDNLVDEFNRGAENKKVKIYIRENIENSVEQIKMAQFIKVGQNKFWAGKVVQQTLVIERNN